MQRATGTPSYSLAMTEPDGGREKYGMASDRSDRITTNNLSGPRQTVRVPGGYLHAWTGDVTLCGLEDIQVRLWPEEMRWNRGNYFTCRKCLAIAEAKST